MESPTSAEGSISKPAKRSLFNRPAGRKAPPQTTSTSANLFERSKQSFDAILAERQQRHLAKEARQRKQDEAARRRELDGLGPRKKTRLSEDTDDEAECGDDAKNGIKRYAGTAMACVHYAHLQPSSPPNTARPCLVEPSEKTRTSPETAPKSNVSTSAKSKPPLNPSSAAINIDSGSDSEVDTASAHIHDGRPDNQFQQRQDEDVEPLEEFPELVAAARARVRQRELEIWSQIQQSRANTVSKGADAINTRLANSSPSIVPDPIVKLLITSPIAGCRPLIVSRKLSQRLQEVRAAWCSKQTFPPSLDVGDVFLTWRGRRIFDVTSCKSLGIAVDAMGTVFVPGQKIGLTSTEVDGLTDEGDEEGSVKVHLEAVTEEILELLKREKAERKAQNRPSPKTDFSVNGNASTNTAAETEQLLEKGIQIRIILRAKGMTDYKIIVKPVSDAAIYHFIRCVAFPVFPIALTYW